ncbi:MAG TPA: type I methionyl aminopeptidase [Chitinophagales bacterium]|nr:type I methionyl aminopeptidase [Chitinophagales bacterium]
MIYHKTPEEIEYIRQSSLLVSRALAEVARHIKPGVTTLQLDLLADQFIRDHGGVPAFLGYRGFPNSACISVNEVVVHGIPGEIVLKEGDIVTVDIGVLLEGFYGDSAYTFPVGEISAEKQRLLRVTKESLDLGVQQARMGRRIGDIASAIQEFVEQHGYSVVRELVGHGVGKKLHEDPEVPNYGKRGSGPKLMEGLVIAIEPMVNMGKRNVMQANDGWTIFTEDHKPSAHFEHTVAVTKNGPDVLTTFEFIEEIVATPVSD